MFLLGLSGVIPLSISGKQRAFYIIPTLPYFAISFALLCKSYTEILLSIIKKNNFINIVRIVSLLIFTVALVIIPLTMDKYVRDKKLQEDVDKIIKTIGKQSSISVSKKLVRDWYLQAYLARYGKISITTKSKQNFMLVPHNDLIPKSYKKLNVHLNNFYLLTRVKNERQENQNIKVEK